MIKKFTVLWVVLSATVSLALAESKDPGIAPNGMSLTIPEGWKNWHLISVAQRTDKKSLRAHLGNSIAVEAARSGNTNPWPEGTIIAKIFWSQKISETNSTAIVPDKLIHVDFIEKNSKKFASTGGWGWGRFLGKEMKPYEGEMNCTTGCHNMVKNQDFVFTRPAPMPD